MAGDSNYKERYVAALDVGTTTIRCQIINSKAVVAGAASAKVRLRFYLLSETRLVFVAG